MKPWSAEGKESHHAHDSESRTVYSLAMGRAKQIDMAAIKIIKQKQILKKQIFFSLSRIVFLMAYNFQTN